MFYATQNLFDNQHSFLDMLQDKARNFLGV
jgi:hypothetical protein